MTKKSKNKFVIQRNIDNNPWYTPWTDCLKREADFEVDYSFVNENFTPFVGMPTHFKYTRDDKDVWIIMPEFLDAEGIVMMDKREIPPLCGKAEMWIVNSDNIKIHKSKLFIGMKAYMTFFNTIIAELIVTKINIP